MYKSEAIDKKKLSRNVWKIWFFTNPTKPTPQENMNQIFDKIWISKERKDHGFLLFFFLTRECVNYLPDIADSECNDAA